MSSNFFPLGIESVPLGKISGSEVAFPPAEEFPLPDALKYKTLITQEMLKKGILATTIIFVCTEHTPAFVDQYFEALDPVFALIKECESGRFVDDLLEGPVCHAGFKRLN